MTTKRHHEGGLTEAQYEQWCAEQAAPSLPTAYRSVWAAPSFRRPRDPAGAFARATAFAIVAGMTAIGVFTSIALIVGAARG